MAISQGNVSSGPFGLSLVAWAAFDGVTGALIKGAGVSSTSRVSVGNYRVNFSPAISDLRAVLVARSSAASGADPVISAAAMLTTAQAQVVTLQSAAAVDPRVVHFEAWV